MSGKTTIIGVIPSYSRTAKQNVYGRVRMPPVGLAAVLSQISHRPDVDAYIIDENNYGGPLDHTGMPDHVFLQLRNPAKAAFFYGGMSNSVPRMYAVAQQYQNWRVTTIAGGSHVDTLPDEALRSGIDIDVHGEGEDIVKELLPVLDLPAAQRMQALERIVGISYLNGDNERVSTGRRPPITNLDDYVPTDLTLIKHLRKRWSAIPISRGRGCNHRCEFCLVNTQYGPYKASSIERVVKDVIRYADLGYTNFFFTDDNFAQDAKGEKDGEAPIELCRRIGEYRRAFMKNLSFTAQVRHDVAYNDKLIAAMRYAGVKGLAIGFESPINEELKAMRKGLPNITVEELVERSRKLAEHFYIHGMFIFGYPTDLDSKYRCNLTLEERAKAYQRFFKAARLDTVQVFNAIPLPGTPLCARLQAEGRVYPLTMRGYEKYDGSYLCYDPKPDGLDPYELEQLPRALMHRRYLGRNFMERQVNYGNWFNWAANVFGFPLQFSAFYAKRFVRNIREGQRERFFDEQPPRIFHDPLLWAWKDVKRRWRNLAVKTYAGSIVRRWHREERNGEQ